MSSGAGLVGLGMVLNFLISGDEDAYITHHHITGFCIWIFILLFSKDFCFFVCYRLSGTELEGNQVGSTIGRGYEITR